MSGGADLVTAALGQSSMDTFVLSDVGNGELLVDRHGRDVHFVHPWNAWLVWDGAKWKPDDTGASPTR